MLLFFCFIGVCNADAEGSKRFGCRTSGIGHGATPLTGWMDAEAEMLMKCMTRFRIYIGAHHCKKPIDRARRKLHEPAWLARCYRPLCFESGGIITPKLCRCCSESAWMPPCTVLLTFDLLGFLLEAGSQGSQRSALKGASPAGTPRSNKSVQFGGIGGVKMPKIRIPKMG